MPRKNGFTFFVSGFTYDFNGQQVIGQDDLAKFCRDQLTSELLRPDYSCRRAIKCTLSGPIIVYCSPGMAFDVDRQICIWKNLVKNCAQTEGRLI